MKWGKKCAKYLTLHSRNQELLFHCDIENEMFFFNLKGSSFRIKTVFIISKAFIGI